MDKNIVVDNIRSFNRLYTNILGLLNRHMLDSEFSLTEMRILYEVGKKRNCTAGMIVKMLKIDKSYLSRILSKFEKKNLLYKQDQTNNSRVKLLKLSNYGEQILQEMEEKSSNHLLNLISKLNEDQCREIDRSINILKKNLLISTELVKIREFDKKDIDVIISEQIDLYEKECDFKSKIWNEYLTSLIKEFSEKFDKKNDCMYVLDYEGEILGSVAIVKIDENTAQLRFFYVNSKLRGIGAGKKLIDAAIQFCKDKNYNKIFLWTADILIPARKLYASKGFKLMESKINKEWSEIPFNDEKWELDLDNHYI